MSMKNCHAPYHAEHTEGKRLSPKGSAMAPIVLITSRALLDTAYDGTEERERKGYFRRGG